MAAVVVDVVETLSQLLRTLAHCRRTVKISKRTRTSCDRENEAFWRSGGMIRRGSSSGAKPSRFRLTKSLSRVLLAAFCCSMVRYTSHALTRLLNI
jgi:hypothetical protein